MNRRMSSRALFLAALGTVALAFQGCATAPRPANPLPAAGTQQPRHFATTTTTRAAYDYQIFLPRNTDQASGTADTRRWPLIVFLHGAGERGTDVAKVTVHGPPKIVGSRPDFPFIVASPQCPDHGFWDPVELDLFLDHLLADYPIDSARVYLTGLSMGGNGTWAWATRSPHRFAAIAPICGWSDTVRVWLSSGPSRDRLATLPIWAFHGGKDGVIPLADSQAMVQAFERIGNHPKLTVYPEAGHDSWSAAYADPALYTWFLEHRRR